MTYEKKPTLIAVYSHWGWTLRLNHRNSTSGKIETTEMLRGALNDDLKITHHHNNGIRDKADASFKWRYV